MAVDENVLEEVVIQLQRADDLVDVNMLAGVVGLDPGEMDEVLAEIEGVVRTGDLVGLESTLADVAPPVLAAQRADPPPAVTRAQAPVVAPPASAIAVRDVLAQLTGDTSGRVRAEVWLEARPDGSMALVELIRIVPAVTADGS